jgi:phytoene dehydrogenase-like protein
MPGSFDVIVLGGGTNGLVAATVLARQGRKVLLLEDGERLGVDVHADEFAPGFRAPMLTLDQGWLPPPVAAAVGVTPPARVSGASSTGAALGGGEFLTLPSATGAAADAIRRFSARDAERWPAFTARLRKLAGFLEALYVLPAPDLDTTSVREVLPLLGLGRKFRALGKEDMVEVLRVLPMAVQELVDDWFESEPLKAAIAAAAVQDIRQGPRSGGTSFILLHHLTGAEPGALRRNGWWREGPDALVAVLEAAARGAGVTLRADGRVASIAVRDDAVAGVVLASGEEIGAQAVLSTLDPSHTLLRLVDPVWLPPEVLHPLGTVKYRGARATVCYALEGDPGIPGADVPVSLTPTTTALERACDASKYGAVSERPHLTVTVPTLRWPGLAPSGQHVLVAHVQWAPYQLRQGAWDSGTTAALAASASCVLEEAVPGFSARVRHQVALSPADLETRYGLTEGSVPHGELTLDQILFMRPIPGLGRHRMPVAGLYLGGAGAHPGPGVLGGPAWLAARALLDDRKGK